MTIETSDRPCPDCGADLQVIYISELKQVVSGWSCGECGYCESEKHRFRARVPKPEHSEYVLRIEKPLTSDDVRDPLGDVEGEFRARASADMEDDEVWLLIDPESGDLVDIVAGDAVDASGGDGEADRDSGGGQS